MNKVALKGLLWQEFKNDAAIVINNYIQENEMNCDCADWGGCFTSMPSGVSFNDIKQIIDSDKKQDI